MDTNIKNILIVLLALIGAGGILMVSVSRATLEVMMRDEMEGRLRVDPVIIQDRMVYKLPQTNMLPDNIFYNVKEGRDWLWYKFSHSNEEKVKTTLILADKRIAEARVLAKKGKFELALETGMTAVNKLKYAKGLTEEEPMQPIAQRQLTVQIKDATVAYSEIIKELGQQIGINNQKYNLLQKNIDDFKEEQLKEKTPERK